MRFGASWLILVCPYVIQELGGGEVVVQDYPPPSDQASKAAPKTPEPQFSLPPDIANMVADMAKQYVQQPQQQQLQPQQIPDLMQQQNPSAISMSESLPPNMQAMISQFMVRYTFRDCLDPFPSIKK